VRTRAAADLPALLGEYVQHLRVCRYAPATIERACRELPRLFEHLSQHCVRDARAVSEAQLASYLAQRRRARHRRSGEPLSASSYSATVSTIRRFFAFLERRGLILCDPAACLPVLKVRALPRHVLSEAQARRLMAAPFPGTPIGQRDRAILETLYGTGLRLAELVRCDLGDLDLAQGLLLVRNGKGRKDRLVPIPGRALLALGVYLAEARPVLEHHTTPALFVSRFGQRLGRRAVQVLARRHGQAVRVHVSPHALRHACATHLVQGGADIRHVQKLLGHKCITTTTVYTRVAIADLRAVFSRSHPRSQPSAIKPAAAITPELLRQVLERAHPRRTTNEPAGR